MDLNDIEKGIRHSVKNVTVSDENKHDTFYELRNIQIQNSWCFNYAINRSSQLAESFSGKNLECSM